MKFKQLHPAGTLAIWFGLAATSQAQLTLNYNFTPNLTVTDNGQVSSVQTLGGLSGLTSITDVNVSLNLTSGNAADPMYLGDIYSSLTLGNSSEAQRIAVLLNRAGRSNTDAFGSGLSSLNVTLDDSASTNVYGTSSSTGSYMPDGRLSANPNGAGVVFASGSNGLSALNGSVPTSDRVSLLVADYSQGGTATLAAWGLSVTGTINSGSPFTPGANVSINDAGTGSSNTVSSALDTSGAASGGGSTGAPMGTAYRLCICRRRTSLCNGSLTAMLTVLRNWYSPLRSHTAEMIPSVTMLPTSPSNPE